MGGENSKQQKNLTFDSKYDSRDLIELSVAIREFNINMIKDINSKYIILKDNQCMDQSNNPDLSYNYLKQIQIPRSISTDNIHGVNIEYIHIVHYALLFSNKEIFELILTMFYTNIADIEHIYSFDITPDGTVKQLNSFNLVFYNISTDITLLEYLMNIYKAICAGEKNQYPGSDLECHKDRLKEVCSGYYNILTKKDEPCKDLVFITKSSSQFIYMFNEMYSEDIVSEETIVNYLANVFKVLVDSTDINYILIFLRKKYKELYNSELDKLYIEKNNIRKIFKSICKNQNDSLASSLIEKIYYSIDKDLIITALNEKLFDKENIFSNQTYAILKPSKSNDSKSTLIVDKFSLYDEIFFKCKINLYNFIKIFIDDYNTDSGKLLLYKLIIEYSELVDFKELFEVFSINNDRKPKGYDFSLDKKDNIDKDGKTKIKSALRNINKIIKLISTCIIDGNINFNTENDISIKNTEGYSKLSLFRVMLYISYSFMIYVGPEKEKNLFHAPKNELSRSIFELFKIFAKHNKDDFLADDVLLLYNLKLRDEIKYLSDNCPIAGYRKQFKDMIELDDYKWRSEHTQYGLSGEKGKPNITDNVYIGKLGIKNETNGAYDVTQGQNTPKTTFSQPNIPNLPNLPNLLTQNTTTQKNEQFYKTIIPSIYQDLVKNSKIKNYKTNTDLNNVQDFMSYLDMIHNDIYNALRSTKTNPIDFIRGILSIKDIKNLIKEKSIDVNNTSLTDEKFKELIEQKFNPSNISDDSIKTFIELYNTKNPSSKISIN